MPTVRSKWGAVHLHILFLINKPIRTAALKAKAQRVRVSTVDGNASTLTRNDDIWVKRPDRSDLIHMVVGHRVTKSSRNQSGLGAGPVR